MHDPERRVVHVRAILKIEDAPVYDQDVHPIHEACPCSRQENKAESGHCTRSTAKTIREIQRTLPRANLSSFTA
ncbi:hypothetical protein WOLCODRAFT_135962 [Wolfiporia cocos MD-104 SS10]|uniref:Uncharacterized protein n=1 Tax=Wolfiporia cocos (strain MD-104) TaxID=742152 RepID=A0A2H3JPM6_WOLCO|nr:hypothetical protein WOLCODRAFT_135962 [Wolfiporia cocos MD-104 SS10]